MPPVIYEVNLAIDGAVFSDYVTWLSKHIREILCIDGFESCELMEHVEAEPGSGPTAELTNGAPRLLVVQYRVASREKLQVYFDEHADAMRADGIKRFGDRFRAWRRILVPFQPE